MTDRKPATESTSSPSDGQGSSSPQSATSNTAEQSIVVRSQTQNSGFFSKFRYHLYAVGFAFLLSPLAFIWPGQAPVDPTNYAERTRRVLKTTP